MLLSSLSKPCRASCAALLSLSLCVVSQTHAQQPPPSPNPQSSTGNSDVDTVDLDVLMRGPVHEGFAEPMVGTGDFLRLPEPPPEPIEELPASVRPTDPQRDAVWVPGYWGLEGEADELCWVSGTWRYPPPGTRWVPGYWADVEGESIWIPGFWVDSDITRIQYLPAPPEPRSWEPVDSPPGPDYFWVPGSWVWEGDTYAWHDGYWAQSHPNWVWVPSRFVYTPRGYVSVPGYWDYPPQRRGLLFAPVRIARYDALARPYRPAISINVAQAFVHWFVRPQYGHYYFGDYYSDRYAQMGFSPWAGYTQRVTYYDPLYVYYRSTGGDFLQNLVSRRQRIVTSGDVQLPITYSELRQSQTSAAASAAVAFAQPVEELLQRAAGDASGGLEVERLSDADFEQQREQVSQLREFVQNRSQIEADAEARARAGASAEMQGRAEARASADAEAGADGQGEAAGRDAAAGQLEQTQDGRERPEGAEAARENQREQVEARREQLEDRREQSEERRPRTEDGVEDRPEAQPQTDDRPAERGQDAAERPQDAPREGLPADAPPQRQAIGERPDAGDSQPLERRADDARRRADDARRGAAEAARRGGGFGEFDMSPFNRRGAQPPSAARGDAPRDAAPGQGATAPGQQEASRRQLPPGLQPPENLDRQRMQRMQQLQGQQGQGRDLNDRRRQQSPSAPGSRSPQSQPQSDRPSAPPGLRPGADPSSAAPTAPGERPTSPGASGARAPAGGNAPRPADRPAPSAGTPAAPAAEAPAAEAPAAPAPSPAPSPAPQSDDEGEDD